MKKYKLYQPLLLAFYSKPLYRDVAQNWRGLALRYLLLITLLCSLVFACRAFYLGTHALVVSQTLVDQLPTITLTQGEVSVDKPEPFYLKDPETDRVLAIIDTTGQVSSLDNTTALALLTKNSLLIKENNDVKSHDLSHFKDQVYTHAVISKYLHDLFYGLVFIAGVLAIPFYFLLGLIEALFYSGLTKLFLRTGLSYQAVYRLAVVALTPAFILSAILTVLGISVPYHWAIYILLSIGYLIYGVQANWEPSKNTNSTTSV